jgi:hypothetical protein
LTRSATICVPSGQREKKNRNEGDAQRTVEEEGMETEEDWKTRVERLLCKIGPDHPHILWEFISS